MKGLKESQISTGRDISPERPKKRSFLTVSGGHLHENRSDVGGTSTRNTQDLVQRNLEGSVDFETSPSLLNVESQAAGSRSIRERMNQAEMRCHANDVQKMAVKGQQILQVVDDLLEQAVSLKAQLSEMVTFFETKSCEDCSQPYATEPPCRKNGAAAGSRMISGSIDDRSDLANRESGRTKYKPESTEFNRSRQRESQHSTGIELREQRYSTRLVPDSRDTIRRASSRGREDLTSDAYENLIRLRGGQTASTLNGSQACFDTESVSSKLQQIQDEILELKREVARLTTTSTEHLPICKCRARCGQDIKGGLDMLAKIVSANLLEKTEEIKEMLKEIKSDCYDKLGSLVAGQPNIGGMKVRENQHRAAERSFPSYSKTITQTKNIKGDKTYQDNMELSKTDQTYKTKIDIKPNDGQRPRDILFSVRKKKGETIQNRKEKDERRQTVKEIEKVAKSGDRTITEVDRINEDFAKYPEQAVTEIKRKVTRTQIEMGQDPKEEVVVNVKIYRTVDNKTGKVSETVNELRGESIEQISSIKSSGVSVKRVEPMKNVDRIGSGRDVILPDLSIKPLDRTNPLLYNTMRQQVEEDAQRRVYSPTSSNQDALRSILSKSKRSDIATYFEIVDENNERKSLSDKCRQMYGESRDEIDRSRFPPDSRGEKVPSAGRPRAKSTASYLGADRFKDRSRSSPTRSDDRIARATEPLFDRSSRHDRDEKESSKDRSRTESRGSSPSTARHTLQSKSAESLKQVPKTGQSFRRFSYQEGDDARSHYAATGRKFSRDSIKSREPSPSRVEQKSKFDQPSTQLKTPRGHTLQSKSEESLKQMPRTGQSSRRFSYHEGDDEKSHYSQPPRKISRDSIDVRSKTGTSESKKATLREEGLSAPKRASSSSRPSRYDEFKEPGTGRGRSILQSISAESLKQTPKTGQSSRRFSYHEGDDEKSHYSKPPRKISKDSISSSKSRETNPSSEEVRESGTRRDRSTLQSKSAESLKQTPKAGQSPRRSSYHEGDDEKSHYSKPPRKISKDSISSSKSREASRSAEKVRESGTRRDRSKLQSKSAESLKQTPKTGQSSRRFSYHEGDDEKSHYSQPPRKISRDSVNASKSREARLSPEELRESGTRRDRSTLQSKSAESLKQTPKAGQSSRRFSYHEGDDEKSHYSKPPRKISKDSISSSKSREASPSPEKARESGTRRDRSKLQSKSAESLKQTPKTAQSSRRFSYHEGDDEKSHYSKPPRKISKDSITASKSKETKPSPEEMREPGTRRDRSTFQSQSAESLKKTPKTAQSSRRFSYHEGDDEKSHYSQPPRKLSRDSINASKSKEAKPSPEEIRETGTRRDRSTFQSQSAESLKKTPKTAQTSRRFSYNEGDDEKSNYSQPPRKISRDSINASKSREASPSPEQVREPGARRDRSTLQSKSAESLKQTPKAAQSSRRFSYHEGDDEKSHYTEPPRKISRDSTNAKELSASKLKTPSPSPAEQRSPFDQLSQLSRYVEEKVPEIPKDPLALSSKIAESLKQAPKIVDKLTRRSSYHDEDESKKAEPAKRRLSSGSSHRTRQEPPDGRYTYADDATFFYSVGSKIFPMSDSKLDNLCAERARRRQERESCQNSAAVPQFMKYGRGQMSKSRISRREGDNPAIESVHRRSQTGEISETQEDYEEGTSHPMEYLRNEIVTGFETYNERRISEPMEYRRNATGELISESDEYQRNRAVAGSGFGSGRVQRIPEPVEYREIIEEMRRSELRRATDPMESPQNDERRSEATKSIGIKRDDGRRIPESAKSRDIVPGRSSKISEAARTVRNPAFTRDDKSQYRRNENAGSELRKSKDILVLRESILEDINETEDQEMPKSTKYLPKSRDEWSFKHDASNTKMDELKSTPSSDTDDKSQSSQFILMQNLQERDQSKADLARRHSKVQFLVPRQTNSSIPKPLTLRDTSRNGSAVVGADTTNEARRSRSGREATIAASAATTTPAITQDSICSVEVQNMHKIIDELSGRRNPNEFFVSVLPETVLSKTLRVNIIDKETGDLLGFFYVNEDNFQSARRNGVFDNYLALYVLNSIGSISDVRDGLKLNSRKFRRYQCFEQCSCKKK